MDIKQLIADAALGDRDAIEEISTAINVLHALRSLREHRTVKHSLMILGKHYFSATLEQLGEIFHADKSTVSKAIRRG